MTMSAKHVDIVRRGHVAAAVRAAMERLQLSPGDLHDKLGLKRSGTTAYGWLSARSTPGPNIRKKVAKLLDIPEKELLPRDLDAPPTQHQALNPLVPQGIPHGVRKPTPSSDVLSFSVGADGLARVRLDVVLPIETAAPLFRQLLDADYILRQQGTKEPDA
jgi:transcriptional regulator with XRE-family HTH domain